MDSIQLTFDTSAGKIDIAAQQDRMGDMLIQTSIASLGDHLIIRKRWSFNDESTNIVYAQDNDHSVTFVAKDTNDPEVGEFIIWHDNDTPNSFRLDLSVLAATMDIKSSIVDGPMDKFDVVGRRNPPPITSGELYSAVKDRSAYRLFMHGQPSATSLTANASPEERKLSWKCWVWCTVPACGIVCLFWAT